MKYLNIILFLSIAICDCKLLVANYKDCPSLPPRSEPPTSIRDLRPDDIQAIIGIGDSLMAGLNSRIPHRKNNISSLVSIPVLEFRGGNYITGGDWDSTSVGNILAHYNPSIDGLSHGNTTMIYCYGPVCPAGTKMLPYSPESMGLNAAQSGAWTTIHNTLNQLKYLDRYYQSFIPKSIKNAWKLMFLELGFNNVCLGCVSWLKKWLFSADNYEKQIIELIESIRARWTNVLITLMAPFNMSQLHLVTQRYPDCQNLEGGIVGCFCNDPKYIKHGRESMDKLSVEYNQRLEKIALDYQAKNYNNFAVVYDPALGGLEFSNATEDSLSGADCFHPSHQSHNRAGYGIFNNLFRKQEDKLALNIKTENYIECPDENTRIWLP